MDKKRDDISLQEEINNDEDWRLMLGKPGIYVVEVYTEWCGPCLIMIPYLERIKLLLNNGNLHLAVAKSDYITAIEKFRQLSQPHWMFFFDGKYVNIVIDIDPNRLIKTITDEVENYGKFKRGEIKVEFMPINRVTDEERRTSMEKKAFELQETKKKKHIREKRMMKVRERILNNFSQNVQMETCVMFFPHTVTYVMEEKAPEVGAEELDEDAEPVMVEKRVCEVANKSVSNYSGFRVSYIKDVQLTEDTLSEMFSVERDVLESFPPGLIDDFLSKKVYSIMLSLTEEEDEAEEKMSMIIYGNRNPLNPSPDSFAAKHMSVNSYGENVPALYTPTNQLSKTSALTVLFNKYCVSIGYVPPEPPKPQYLIIFEIIKTDIVLPIIEDIEDNIVCYGFFRSADPENPRLLCKNHELLINYGIEKVRDAKLVLSVLQDDRDKSMLRFINAGPIYVSPDSETGIDDADHFFPYNFDEMEGEIQMWLDQLAYQKETAESGEYELGENDEEMYEIDTEGDQASFNNSRN